MQYECKLREVEKKVNKHYAREIKNFQDKVEMFKKEKHQLKTEINTLQKQKFFLRMQNFGRLLV